MLRSGSICISFLYNYLLSEIGNEKEGNEKEGNDGNNLIKKSAKLE